MFQHWDGIDRNWNPGGLWRPVRLYDTGRVRVDRFRVLCRDADSTRAHVLLYARLDSDDSRRVRIRTLVDGRPITETERSLASGLNDVSWNLDIDSPALWWPRTLGEQPLTEMSIEVMVDGQLSDRRRRRTGLREVAWNDWVCSVNGERLFLKGANLLPTPRWARRRQRRARSGATSNSRRKQGSTCSASTATSRHVRCTTRPTSWGSC